LTPPGSIGSAWGQLNSSSGVYYTDFTGGINFRLDSGSTNWRVLQADGTPSSAFTVTAAFTGVLPGTAAAGIVLLDGSGKFSIWGYLNNAGVLNFQAANYTNYTTGDSNDILQAAAVVGPVVWLRVMDDGSTWRVFFVSTDGVHWVVAGEVSRTHFLTPNAVGFGVTPGANLATGVNLIHWQVTNP
jgi:hypothetical protein